MREKHVVFVVSFLLFVLHSSGQVDYDSTLMKILYSDTSAYKRWKLSSPLVWDSAIKRVGNAIKKGDTLYYLPDESGALFEVIREADSFQCKRLDRTIFGGYNGRQYGFIDDGHVCGYGGYGIWRTNGQLRVYVPNRSEWEIIKLNKEVATYNEFTYYDPVRRELWCGKQDLINEVYTSDHYETRRDMLRLSLASGAWENLGEVVLPGSVRDNDAITVCETPFGALVFETGGAYVLYDYPNNRRLGIAKAEDSIRHYFSAKANNRSLIPVNNKLLVYDIVAGSILKEIELVPADFRILDDEIYKKGVFKNWYLNVISLLLVIGIAVFIYFRKKKQVKLSGAFSDGAANGVSTTGFLRQLKSQEKVLLDHIWSETQQGRKVRTEDLNRIMGTSSKSPEVQKKHRSDLISGLNSTYRSFFRTETALIITSQSESDRRIREYHLSEEGLQHLQSLPESSVNG